MSPDPRHELQHARRLLLLAAALYPPWSFIFVRLSPHAVDPIGERLAFSGLCFAIVLSSFVVPAVRASLRTLTVASMFVLTAHYLTLLERNDGSLLYIVGIFIVMSALNAVLDTRATLVAYNIATILGAVVYSLHLSPNAPLVGAGLATISLVSYLGLERHLVLVATLRAKTADLEATFRAIPDEFFKLTRVGVFIAPEAVSGKRLEDVFPEPLAGRMREALETCVLGDGPTSIEYQLEGDGTQWRECRFVPSTGGGDVVAVVRNISGRVRAEQMIRQQQASIVAKSRLSELGAMSAGLAHEINNPLTVVLGRAGQITTLLQQPEPPLAMIARSAEKIRTNSERIAKIVQGLRAFARDGEQDPFTRERLWTIVAETLELCRERITRRGITLRVAEIDPELTLDCRPVQLSKVLLNLINNAYDAVETGPDPWIAIDVADRGDLVEISVTDNGPGVPEAIREKILQPFFTTKEPGKGTGLGLSISKGLIESHGGALELDAKAAQARFVVTLPKRAQAKAA